MGTYTVQPNNRVEIDNGNNKITFPANEGTEPINYTVTYTDDNDCSDSTTVTVLHDLCHDYYLQIRNVRSNKPLVPQANKRDTCDNVINFKYEESGVTQDIQITLWRMGTPPTQITTAGTGVQFILSYNSNSLESDVDDTIQNIKNRLTVEVTNGDTLHMIIKDLDNSGAALFTDSFTIKFNVPNDDRTNKPLVFNIKVNVHSPSFAISPDMVN